MTHRDRVDLHKIKCPECGSTRLWKDGLRYLSNGATVQRWLCRDCGYRFSQQQKTSKINRGITEDCRVGVAGSTPASKNTAKAAVAALKKLEKELEAAPAGEAQRNIKGKIVGFAWWMKKQGYTDESIRSYVSCLRTLFNRGANLLNPESVKDILARQKWSSSRKRNAINAYSLFLKMEGLTWEKPRCKVTRKIPFIPKEEELDALIAGCGKKTATFLQLLKETAMRAGEAKRLLWTDVDFERRIITLNDPEKGSNPRVWKVSAKLMGMLNALPRKSKRVFGDGPINSLKTTYQRARKRLAAKLQNPRLLRVSFHTFRHWKATMLYHQTKDPWYVKEFLGHRSIKSTEIYITVERRIFEPSSDEFTVKVASKPEEIKALLEVGFEYVCEKDGLVFLRKRK